MKKYFKISLIYAIAAMVMGVFYREFTKAYNFTQVTMLGRVHVHLFALGTLVFILIAILSNYLKFEDSKFFRASIHTYNTGLALMSLMFTVRGIFQVINKSVNNGLISGLAGVTHIIFAAGIIMLLISFIQLSVDKKKEKGNK